MSYEARFGQAATAEAYAIQRIKSDYGDVVSIFDKAKVLRKFGETRNADSGVKTTIAEFPGDVVNEDMLVTNAIDSIVSSNAADTQFIRLESHTIDEATGDMTFIPNQVVQLNGQTPVSITPSARYSRFRLSNATFPSYPTPLAGNVSVYDSSSTSVVAGVPQTDTAVHLYVPAAVTGRSYSKKAATTISASDYWLITGARFSIGAGSASGVNALFDIEFRDVKGGDWIPIGLEINLRAGSLPTDLAEFPEFVTIPKNHDVRMVVTTNTNNTTVHGAMFGKLAKVMR